jgi:hypothetical protein
VPAETRVLCYWDNKRSRVEVDIDASDRITAIRRVGPGTAAAVLARPDRSRTHTLPRGAGDASVPVGTGTAARLQLTYDAARNRYDGLAGEILTEG